jgi:hypothetical protein
MFTKKYHRIIGIDAFNTYMVNFYTILKCIGEGLGASHKQRVSVALTEIRKLSRQKGCRVTNSEIHNLARARKRFSFRAATEYDSNIIYKFSIHADTILEIKFNLLKEIFRKGDVDSRCYKNKIRQQHSCRKQVISDLDGKLKHILNNSSKKNLPQIEYLAERILDLVQSC